MHITQAKSLGTTHIANYVNNHAIAIRRGVARQAGESGDGTTVARATTAPAAPSEKAVLEAQAAAAPQTVIRPEKISEAGKID